jgi:hypothetical protein
MCIVCSSLLVATGISSALGLTKKIIKEKKSNATRSSCSLILNFDKASSLDIKNSCFLNDKFVDNSNYEKVFEKNQC